MNGTVSPTAAPAPRFALFALGFRVFFFGASLFAGLTMLQWALVYHGLTPQPLAGVSTSQWHAHEMIYGYGFAVVAGFLLTAVRNWTSLDTPRGGALAALFALWALARGALATGESLHALAAPCDLGFAVALFLAIGVPIMRVRQWRQAGILAKVLLLGAGNAVFYAGAAGALARGVEIGLLCGLYLLVSLVLTIGARVLPGFIERGVGVPVQIRNPAWVVPANIVLLLAFLVTDVFLQMPRSSAALAAGLGIINAFRLVAWHTPALWRKPLLWGLYLAFGAIVAGFLLMALGITGAVPRMLALHAFAVGGVGLATLSMMARVTLGHTGRDIHHPPRVVAPALGLLVGAAVVRIALPLAWPAEYPRFIEFAQALWIAAFLLFAAAYARILWSPRVDGKPG